MTDYGIQLNRPGITLAGIPETDVYTEIFRSSWTSTIRNYELSRSPLFNVIVSKSRDWSRRIRMRPRGVCYYSVITQSISQLGQTLSLNDVDCYHAECSFYVPRKCSSFITYNLSCFLCSLGVFYIFITGISQVRGTKIGGLYWKLILMFVAVLSVAINHRYRRCTLLINWYRLPASPDRSIAATFTDRQQTMQNKWLFLQGRLGPCYSQWSPFSVRAASLLAFLKFIKLLGIQYFM